MSTSARNIELKENYETLEQLKEDVDGVKGFDLYANYWDLVAAAERWATSLFPELDNDEREDYFRSNGLVVNTVHCERVRYALIWVEDLNINVPINWYEAYIDSGVPYEDYFKGVVVDW